MPTVASSRTIAAPLPEVFRVVSDVRNFKEAIDHILEIEFLTEQQLGVGTRFKETREMNGRKATVTLEGTEYELDAVKAHLEGAG